MKDKYHYAILALLCNTWLFSSCEDHLGEYVYCTYDYDEGSAVIHTKRDCYPLVDFVKVDSMYQIIDGFDCMYCTKCVTDKQYSKLVYLREKRLKRLEREAIRREKKKREQDSLYWEQYRVK